MVAGADEAEVDDLVAELATAAADPDGAAAEATDTGADRDAEIEPATRRLVAALRDGARRLREDPTDMAADGEVAEVAARVFALDHVPGIDGDRWAAIGRVTRRLLGALGADVALDEEIATEAAVLCRLLEPVLDPADWDGAAAGDGAGQEGEASEEGEEGGEGAPDRHEVVYDLSDWLLEERARLGLVLEREGISYGWEGTDVVVSELDWERVDRLCSEVVSPAPTDDDDDDGEERYQALSELFGSADRLAGDAEDKSKRKAVLEAAQAVTSGRIPIGMSDDQWWQIRARVKTLCESVDEDLPPEVVRLNASSLSDLLRGFV